jgi:cytochrome c-type biogenesis protein CcmE
MPHRKLVLPAVGFLAVVIVILVVNGLNGALTYYLTPSEAVARRADFPDGERFRLGGLVVKGSVRDEAGIKTFTLTDGAVTINVRLTGATPPLFSEDVGVVVEGAWQGDLFAADIALIRHDENYSPPEGYQAPSG